MTSRMSLMANGSTILRDKDSRIYDRIDSRANRVADRKMTTTPDNLGIEDDNEDTAQRQIPAGQESSKCVTTENGEFFVKYRGKSYEISDLLKKHPGGRSIGAYRGLTLDKVMTEVSHSDAAFHLLEEFAVVKRKECDDIENLVDWNEPLLGQVGELADRYWEWMNLPVNRPVRLFKTDFLEKLTITTWYMIPIVWIPIIMYFLYLGFRNNNSENIEVSVPVILLALSSGILLWTFLEYVLHRNFFHLKPPPNSKKLITLHFLFHGLHHKAPFDSQRLVFPPAGSILVAMILYKLYMAVLPDVIVYFVGAGTMIGYVAYDLTHYYLHNGSPRAESYMYVMKRYHNHHHFSHNDTGFGISSRLWDYVFGSLIPLKKLGKSIVW